MATQDDSETKKKTKRGGTVCAAINCHNRYHNSDITFFRFPKDKQRYISFCPSDYL